LAHRQTPFSVDFNLLLKGHKIKKIQMEIK
jgi:hypothetical protein